MEGGGGEDTPENIEGVVRAAAQNGADYIIPAFGLTLREGSREHFYRKLDQHFPGLRREYERTFGSRYECAARNQGQLVRLFYDLCAELGLQTRVSTYPPKSGGSAIAALLTHRLDWAITPIQ